MDFKSVDTLEPTKGPVLTKKKREGGTRLQLYNPQHKLDLLKLFTNVRRFTLGLQDGEFERQKEGQEMEFRESEDEEELESEIISEEGADAEGKDSKRLSCGTCGVNFSLLVDLRNHYRLDWHRYNLKRKLHSQEKVTEGQFDDMMDDLSSIDGSDSENEESTPSSTASTDAVSRLMDKVSKINVSEEFGPQQKLKKGEAKVANSPKLYFENENGNVFGIYKAVAELGIDERVMLEDKQGTLTFDFRKSIEVPINAAIIMASGGHFAAAVFRGGEVISHKTFHSYTVRAKQGGGQSSKDSKSGTSHPKSAGASLRRYNEQSFSQHIQDLLNSWATMLSKCQIVFHRAAGNNANVLFGGKIPVLQRTDPKLRTIPFPTKRPTFAEVKRVHSLLTVLHIYDNREEFLSEHLQVSTKKQPSPKKTQKPKLDRAKSRSPKRREDPVEAAQDSSSDEDVDLVAVDEEIDMSALKEYDDSLTPAERESGRKRRSRVKKQKPEQFPKPAGAFGDILDALSSGDQIQSESIISSICREAEDSTTDEKETFLQNVNQFVDFNNSSFLHLAAKKNAVDIVWALLEHGCDPCARDKNGKLPYNYAESKECRAIFRKFMGAYPEKYDYKQAQVPAPITEEMEAEKAEKKRLLNKLKREKEKLKKQEKMEKEKEINEKQRYLNLSDREKRALAAEQRILAQCKRTGEASPVLVRCFECACDMTGKVPFEYNQNIFCTTKCLAVHRKKFPTPLTV